MPEADADQVKPEAQNLTRVERIKAGIGKWVESQMPAAIGERYKKTFTVFAEKLAGNRPELLARLQGPIEAAAKFAGWADPVVKVIVGAAALYGGVQLLINPGLAVGLGKAAVFYGKEALAAGTAVAVGAYKFVETGVKELGAKVKLIAERIWQGVTGAEIPSQTHPPGGFPVAPPEAPPFPKVPIVKPIIQSA